MKRERGTKMATCRYCGRQIEWAVNGNGRKIPVNGDGENHFRTCGGWQKAKARESERRREERRMEKFRAAAESDARQLKLF